MPPPARRTILVVEDDSALRDLYRHAPTLAGSTVVAVGDGWSALRWIEADRPDGILLDIELPRLSGRDVQTEVASHAETRDIPIVVVIGTASERDLNGGAFRALLRKPVDPAVVVHTMQQYVRLGGSSRRPSRR